MLPEELKARALRRARNRRISFGELVRESLAGMLEQPARGLDDTLLGDDAIFHGKAPRDLSRDHDRYLYGDEG